MIPEVFAETWDWLIGLSQVQLILLGGGVALLVALSKVFRLLFLAFVLLLFLVVLLPRLLAGSTGSWLSGPEPGGRAVQQEGDRKGDDNGS